MCHCQKNISITMILMEYQEKKKKKQRGAHSFMSWMKGLFILTDIESFSYFVTVELINKT